MSCRTCIVLSLSARLAHSESSLGATAVPTWPHPHRLTHLDASIFLSPSLGKYAGASPLSMSSMWEFTWLNSHGSEVGVDSRGGTALLGTYSPQLSRGELARDCPPHSLTTCPRQPRRPGHLVVSTALGWDIGLELLSLWMDVGASSAVIQAGA
jgi:hypothetical protein